MRFKMSLLQNTLIPSTLKHCSANGAVEDLLVGISKPHCVRPVNKHSLWWHWSERVTRVE